MYSLKEEKYVFLAIKDVVIDGGSFRYRLRHIVAMVASIWGVSNSLFLFVVPVRAHVHPVSDRAQDGRVVDARALYQT